MRTASLLLRPPAPADAEAVLRACQDPEIARWTAVPSPYTAADARAWVEVEALAGWAEQTHLVWFACDPAAPETPLVSIGLHHLDISAGSAEIGYWAAPHARGRGLTTAAVAAVCRYAFDELGLPRVEWVAGVGNDASRRVAEKVGFVVEATSRQRLVLHGHREDAWVGGLLPTDLPEAARLELGGTRPGASGPTHTATRAARPYRWEPVRGVEITAGSLHLRPWRPEDLEVLTSALAAPRIARRAPTARTGSAHRDAEQFLTRAQDEDAAHVEFAVVDATTGEVLGGLALHHLDLETNDSGLDHWTVPAARGRDVATHAVGALARWAFGALGLDRLELLHATDNPESCRIAERTGFAYEGALRRSGQYGDLTHRDEHLHARLATDPEPGVS